MRIADGDLRPFASGLWPVVPGATFNAFRCQLRFRGEVRLQGCIVMFVSNRLSPTADVVAPSTIVPLCWPARCVFTRTSRSLRLVFHPTVHRILAELLEPIHIDVVRSTDVRALLYLFVLHLADLLADLVLGACRK